MALLKVPVPELVQVPAVVLLVQDNVMIGLFLQALWSTPAFTVGVGATVIVIASATALHVPLPVEVNVNVNVPALICPADGVKLVTDPKFAFGLKVPPAGVAVHTPPEATVMVPTPVNGTLVLFWQMVLSIPAFTVGAGE